MDADQLISKVITTILNPFIALLFSFAFAVFIWGIIEFILNAENEEKRKQGKKHIVWGLVGLVIMVGVAGIIDVIANFWRGIK